MSEPRTIERFKKRTIWFHWLHTLAFILLVVTGAILIVPGLGGAAAQGFHQCSDNVPGATPG